jgi:probable rRNA maturation factor
VARASEREKRAARRLKKILGALPPALRRRVGIRRGCAAQAGVRVVGSRAMSALNRKWMGKRHATDILSFPNPPLFQREGWLGELVICWPTLARQARAQGHADARELDVLLIHGTLHLLGFDHEAGGPEAREMAAQERRLARKLGLPAAALGLIDRTPTLG